MTDKQKIIDGIDVSGCKHYKNRTCIADYCLTDMPFGEAKCELNPNCYYKQLKRKEQECKALREEKAYTDMACEHFKEQSDRYYQTLVEIKDYCNKYPQNSTGFKKQILQKINEVLDE